MMSDEQYRGLQDAALHLARRARTASDDSAGSIGTAAAAVATVAYYLTAADSLRDGQGAPASAAGPVFPPYPSAAPPR